MPNPPARDLFVHAGTWQQQQQSLVCGLGNSCGSDTSDTVVKFKKGDAGVRVRVVN